MNNRIILSSLAMDLKRVALGLHSKSYKTANRFLVEAMKRKTEVNSEELLPYMKTVLKHVDATIEDEDALMYSTRIQNYVLYK